MHRIEQQQQPSLPAVRASAIGSPIGTRIDGSPGPERRPAADDSVGPDEKGNGTAGPHHKE